MLAELFKRASRAEGREEGRELERAAWISVAGEAQGLVGPQGKPHSRDNQPFTEPEPAPPDS